MKMKNVQGAALLADKEPQQVLVATAMARKSPPMRNPWGY